MAGRHDNAASSAEYWTKHEKTLDFVKGLRYGLISHINNDETRLFASANVKK
jgi:hypothetical protein